MAGRWRSDRASRDKVRSPGRPSVTSQEHRRQFLALIAMGFRARTWRWRLEYRSRSASGGSGRRAGWLRHTCRDHRSCPPCGTSALPSAKRSRSGGLGALACGRLRVAWGERRLRSRASCGGTRRHGVATRTTGRRRRSGMRSGRHVGRSARSSRRIWCCGHMCRTGLPDRSLLLVGQRFPVPQSAERGGGTGGVRTGAGVRRGARSRSPTDHSAISAASSQAGVASP